MALRFLLTRMITSVRTFLRSKTHRSLASERGGVLRIAPAPAGHEDLGGGFHNRSNRAVMLARLLRRQPVAVSLALGSTLLVNVADSAIPLITGAAIDAASGVTHRSIGVLAIVLVVAAIVRYVAQFGRRFLAGRISTMLQHQLRVSLLATLQKLDGPRQDELRTGQVVSRSISDLNLIQAMVAMIPLLVGYLFKVVLVLGIMAWISPLLLLVAVVTLPLIAWLAWRSRRILFAATWSAQQQVANLATHIEETVTGVRVVKAFAQEDHEIAKLEALSQEVYAQQVRAAKMTARYKPVLQQLPSVALVIGIGVGGWLAIQGSITVGAFVAFASYLLVLTSVVSMLLGMVVQMQLGASSLDRVLEVLRLRPAHPDPEAPVQLPHGPLGLRMHNVEFATQGRKVLQHFSIEAHPGETLVLVGPPGAGKTMALQLCCALYRPDAGTVALTSHGLSGQSLYDLAESSRSDVRAAVACVPDEPFLYSDTIWNNITMGLPATLEDVHRVAELAQAASFIGALPQGYEEVVGERGLTLSGGQRQRIAIARALLRRPRVLLLDDATSAIDATTERAIIDGLRRELHDVTVVAIAHRHSTLELADKVALIDEGRTVACGSPQEMATNEQFAHLMDLAFQRLPAQEIIPFDAEEAEPAPDALWPTVEAQDSRLRMSKTAVRVASSQAGANPAMGGRGGRGGQRSSSANMPATPELLARVDALPPATERPPHAGPHLREPLRRVHAHSLFASVRWLVLAVIALYVVGVAAGLVSPMLVRFAIDEGVKHQDVEVLWLIMSIGLATMVLAWLADVLTTVLTARTGERLLYDLRVRSYAHLQRLSMAFYERTMSGTIMTRMTTDIEALNTFLQTGLASAVVSVTTIVGVLVLLGLTSTMLLAIVIASVPVMVVATMVFRRISSRLYGRAREQISEVNALFQEHMAGIRTAQMHGTEQATVNAFASKAEAYRRTRVGTQLAVATYFPGIGAMNELMQAAVLFVGASLVSSGQLGAGVLVAFLLYMDRLYAPIQHLSQIFDSYQQAQVGFRRISALLATEPEVPDAGTTEPGEVHTSRLGLDNVTFRYPGTETATLEHFNARIEPGSTVTIVGPTGSGKSTLVKLIQRLYDPNEGAVRAGETDIREFRVAAWRGKLGYVPQEAHLFAGTVASNIAYGRPNATEQEITHAARRVGALSAIASLPHGFRTNVGERGLGLSSGQRQLIALARAEMIEPSIMVLDEATASLDPASERTILAASQRLTEHRTSIVVAHRLATAQRSDHILVMRDGVIAERGTHAELLSFGGIYATMWGDADHQFSAAQE